MVTNANPNVVPLCDILLVLLIIFMVISPLVQAGVDIALPSSVCHGPGAVVLSIAKEGLITVNNEEFSDLALLEGWLKDLYRTRSDRTIFVQAHKDVLYKYVVRIIDVIKGAEVENICMMPGIGSV
jgi:biopolymer transport protein TolR